MCEIMNIPKEPKTNIFYRLAIINYELGSLSKAIVYMKRFPSESSCHKAEAKLGLQDLLAQIWILCYELNINFSDSLSEGVIRLKERYKEFEKRGWVAIE